MATCVSRSIWDRKKSRCRGEVATQGLSCHGHFRVRVLDLRLPQSTRTSSFLYVLVISRIMVCATPRHPVALPSAPCLHAACVPSLGPHRPSERAPTRAFVYSLGKLPILGTLSELHNEPGKSCQANKGAESRQRAHQRYIRGVSANE